MLPLAAGRNKGGHYCRYFGPSGVRALPLAASINEGGHYFRYFFIFFLGTITYPPPLDMDMCGKKNPLLSMGGRAEGQACTDP